MKHLLTIFLLTLTANATTILDARTNVYNFTNSISVGSVTVSNQINTTISSGAVAIAGGAFTGAVFNPQTTLAGVSNVTLLGGLTGGITSGTLTVNGSTAALGVSAPTSGSYVAQSDSGTITWQPLANIVGTNLNATVYASPYGVTNFFYAAGRTTQTWTWTGGTTNIMIKAWGAGATSYDGMSGSGGFVMCITTVTNNQTLSIQVPYAGSNILTQYMSVTTAGYPGGGGFNTNATGRRGGGGGYASVYSSTNILIIAGGGGGGGGVGGGGSGGWPNGASGNSSPFGTGGTQITGGTAGGSASAGSYLQGGSGSASPYQAGGGGGYYGGGGTDSGANFGAGGGSSYFNTALIQYGYATSGQNSGDINYSANYGASGKDGIVLIITPTP